MDLVSTSENKNASPNRSGSGVSKGIVEAILEARNQHKALWEGEVPKSPSRTST